MKGIFCNNKTAEERLVVTNRLIKLTLAAVILVAGIIAYDFIRAVLSDTAVANHLGQGCSTLSILVCTLCVNIINKKEIEAKLEDK